MGRLLDKQKIGMVPGADYRSKNVARADRSDGRSAAGRCMFGRGRASTGRDAHHGSPTGAGKPGEQATEQTPGILGELPPPVTPDSNPPPAPVFSFSTVDGDEVQLEEFLGTAPVYVFFVPGVDDELDRAQVGRVQDRYSQFEELGVYVFLIVSDLPTKVLQLRDELGLEFPLIADPLNVIATDWKVFDLFGGGKSGPASFVFNAHGVLIARLITAEPDNRPSVDEVLGVIRESLNAAGV